MPPERHAPSGDRGCGRPRARRDARRRACSGCGVRRRTRRGRGCRWRSSSPGPWRCASPPRARTWRGRIPTGARWAAPPCCPPGLTRAGRPRAPGGPRRGRGHGRDRVRQLRAAGPAGARRRRARRGGDRRSPSRGSTWTVRGAWALVGGVGVVLFVAVLVGLAGAGGASGRRVAAAAQVAVPVGAGVRGCTRPAHRGGAAVLLLRRFRAAVPARDRAARSGGGRSG